ncbi:MAG: winged helix-turn-helix transcriptional regulator [Nanoarchaeota archaeon]|nr:winged helix-turn-helix transcriptional regulator [Nanoarchaeota archaeon]
MEEIIFENIWEKYGLKESPYSTSPLRLVGILPIEKVFANRVNELKELGSRVVSASSTRTLVIGVPGVGKTTFCNYLRWHLCRKERGDSKFLTTPIELKVYDNWDNKQFLRSSLAAIYNASIIFNWDKFKTLSDLEAYIKSTKIKSQQGGGQIAGCGLSIGYGETMTLPEDISSEILEDFFLRILKEIRSKGKGLILQYNNLENVDVEKLAKLLQSIREYLQIDGLHTLFLGPEESLSAVERYTQVHSVFGKTLLLNNLTDGQVLEVLSKRCESLKLADGRYIAPYQESTVKELYRMLNGNIRLMFKILNDATLAFLKAPCAVTLKEIKIYSKEEAEKSLFNLNDNEKKILVALADKKALNHGSLAEITKIVPQNLSKYTKNLLNQGLVTFGDDEADKRVTIYRLSENTRLILTFSGKLAK